MYRSAHADHSAAQAYESNGVRLELEAQYAVNLALVHNSVPVVSSLTVTNCSGEPMTDVTLTVEMHGNGHELAVPWKRTVDGVLDADHSVTATDFAEFAPPIEYLGGLDESHSGTIAITVDRLWGDAVEFAIPVQVLAHNEWFNGRVYYDSIAAFVQPNTRAVTTVLDAAAEILRAETGDSALSGYQGGTERAGLIAAAIYEALRARRIRYIDPPASFEDTGQKIRATAQVLTDRFGTCVDLSVTYAACLEAAGLHPLIWLVEGHAFAGFFTTPDARIALCSLTEANAMINLVESAVAQPVDAVFYRDGPDGNFAAACAAARRHFTSPDSLRGVVSITDARHDGLKPLPSSDDKPDEPPTPDRAETGTDAPRHAALELPAQLTNLGGDGDVLDTSDDAPARVRSWKKSLLDLSNRNRLLNLKPSKQVVDLNIPSTGLAALDDIIHAGKSITLHATDQLSSLHTLQGARDASDLDADVLLDALTVEYQVYATVTGSTYSRRFKELGREARRLFEETGSANLYLTLGALLHTTTTGNDARAPLFLLPVKITGGKGNSPFRMICDATELASPNYCLVEWLRVQHNVSIEALESPKRDASGLDIDYALRNIRAALVDNEIDLRIEETATVSICQFGTYGMWRDLDEYWDVLSRSPIVEHLTHHAGESFHDPQAADDRALDAIDVHETEVPVPIPADGSQLRAVDLAARGRSFVLEGPPGTGKSQTITNLIAHAIGSGRTVLFVAEKQAALDVVKKRIGQIGLADFTLDLHGKDQSPNAIRAQLKTAIDNEIRYNDHAWQARLAEYRSKHAPLEDYPSKIHSRNAIDQSLWTSYEDLLDIGDGPAAPVPARFVSAPAVDRTELADAANHFAREARSAWIAIPNPWSLSGPVPLDDEDGHLASAADRLDAAHRTVHADAHAKRIVERFVGPSSIADVLPQAWRQLGRPVPDAEHIARMGSKQFRADRDAFFAELDSLHRACAPIFATLSLGFVEQCDVDAFVRTAVEADTGLFGKKKRAASLRQSLEPFASPEADLRPQAVLPLFRAIPGALEHAERVTVLARNLLGSFLPSGWNPLPADSADALSPAFEYIDATVAFAHAHPDEWALLAESGATQSLVDTLAETAEAWQQWLQSLGADEESFARWRADDHWVSAWDRDHDTWTAECRDHDARLFSQFARLSVHLEPLRRAGLTGFVDALLTGRIAAQDAPIALMRGIAGASLTERRRAGGLTSFDTALRDGEISDFVHAADAVRGEQVRALPAQLLDDRPFHARSLKGDVGDLRRMLNRKRGGATFRQLMDKYAEHILAATPCVFVSPVSLAKFIPPGSATFDLVVFDEASQVTVPQSIGALGRGRSAVIVGDSQQMPPTMFGQASASDDDAADLADPHDEDAVVPDDLESILTECVESGVPRLWLSWHYRSQDESLIHFSNRAYYEGRLASLPSPGGDDTAGIEWRRVDGHFNREDKKNRLRTNVVEAQAIVDEIRARLSSPLLADQSIGVVTFNAQQRDLITDLLDESADPLIRQKLRSDVEEGIFVKNLENVQGDERDVVLFSAAFSKRPGESALPLNFGPLSRAGGEKRFNVAITRARRKVVMFTSFDPTDIDLNRTSSVGLKHLRGYLELAANDAEPEGPGDADDSSDGTGTIQRDVLTALRDRGYEAAANYGLSDFVLDIVVREPGTDHWQLALLLDGPRWADRPTVADRDLTPRLLDTLMQWGATQRLWLPDWIDNRDAVLDRIDADVAAAKERRAAHDARVEADSARRAAEIAEAEEQEETAEEPGEEPEPEELTWSADPAAERLIADSYGSTEPHDRAPTGPSGIPATPAGAEAPAAPPAPGEAMVQDAAPGRPQPIASTAATAGHVPHRHHAPERDWHARGAAYRSAPTVALGGREDLDRVNSASVRATITSAVRQTVDIEGPIEADRLARDIGRRFDFNRVSAARRDFITDCVPAELTYTSPLGTFVWPREITPENWRGYRMTPDDLDRPIDVIAPEEIINAMADMCRGRALEPETLMRETMAVFNHRRMGGTIRERLEACIELGVKDGRLIRGEGKIRAGA